jgi:hypothetical protein
LVFRTTPDFTVTGLTEGERRRIVFRHREKKLGAIATFAAGEQGPVTVRLRPYATVTGRVVDADGRPIPQARLAAFTQGAGEWLRRRRSGENATGPRPLELGEDNEVGQTDADGRFRASLLIPGVKGELFGAAPDARRRRALPTLLAAFTLRSGEARASAI